MKSIELTPIGWVRSSRKEMTDDFWGDARSTLELDPKLFNPESLEGLSDFSHLEIVYQLDRVEKSSIIYGSTYPRGRTDWPKVGIFAQRKNERPNRIGTCICRLKSIQDLSIEVEGLDAIDATPLLDIKPYFKEFGALGPIKQPKWSTELMTDYFSRNAIGPSFQTERLRVQLIPYFSPEVVLDYFVRNRDFFKPTSPKFPEDFYTLGYWKRKLRDEGYDFEAGTRANFGVSLRENPDRMMADISFSQFSKAPFNACYVGYSLDQKENGKGYLTEALKAVIQYMFQEKNIHRIMANHLPENGKSAGVLKRCGFRIEGKAEAYLHINGEWREHILTSITNTQWKEN